MQQIYKYIMTNINETLDQLGYAIRMFFVWILIIIMMAGVSIWLFIWNQSHAIGVELDGSLHESNYGGTHDHRL